MREIKGIEVTKSGGLHLNKDYGFVQQFCMHDFEFCGTWCPAFCMTDKELFLCNDLHYFSSNVIYKREVKK